MVDGTNIGKVVLQVADQTTAHKSVGVANDWRAEQAAEYNSLDTKG